MFSATVIVAGGDEVCEEIDSRKIIPSELSTVIFGEDTGEIVLYAKDAPVALSLSAEELAYIAGIYRTMNKLSETEDEED